MFSVGSAPALFDPPNGAVVAAVVVTLAIGTPLIVLLLSRPLDDSCCGGAGAEAAQGGLGCGWTW